MSTAEQLKSEDAPQSRRGPVPFGNYLLDDLIAVGGMARVYRARLRGALGFEKPLVVKQVRPELAQDPRFVAMFAEEAKTLVRLTHPHIVTVYELGVVDDTYFIAMEYIEGVTLHALIEDGTLSAEFAAHIAAQVCDALHHAHERFDLVHRDVTPRNILIDEEGQTRLVDFGIAVPRDGTGEGEGGFGSVGYMSPEQLRGAALGPRSDVFSLGCAIHQSLFGEVPFTTKGVELVENSMPKASPFASHVQTMLSRAASKRPNAREAGRVFRTWLSKTHPEGVAQELGALVSEVRESQSTELIDPEKTEAGHTSTTRSLATSPLLPSSSEILDSEAENSGTVPLPGRAGRLKPEAPRSSEAVSLTKTTSIPEDQKQEREEPSEARSKTPLTLLLVIGGFAIAGLAIEGVFGSGESGQTESGQSEAEPSLPEPADLNTPPPATSDEVERESDEPDERESDERGDVLATPVEAAALTTTMNASATMQAGPAEASSGIIVFASTPWAEVHIDGRRVGVTPLRERLPRGPHAIRLVNPALGSELRRRVELDGGETLRLRADFNSSPPAFR